MSTHNICFYGEIRKDIQELYQIHLLNNSSVFTSVPLAMIKY